MPIKKLATKSIHIIGKVAPKPSKEKPDFLWVILLGFLCALPALSGDLYLASLPTISKDLNASDLLAQFTITGSWIGGAIGQLICGPLSDRFGRKRPVIVGIVIHIFLSVACSLCQNITTLIVFRVLQGGANACAIVISLSMTRDLYTNKYASKMLSRLVLIIGIAPLLAPTIGALIVEKYSWRVVFYLMGGIGFLVLLVVWFIIPETRPRDKRVNIRPRDVFKTYKEVLSVKGFPAFCLVQGFGQVVFLCWVIAAPFVTEFEWNLPPLGFTLIFAICGFGLIIGALLNSFLVVKIGPKKVFKIFFPLQISFVLCMFLSANFLNIGFWNVIFLFCAIFCANPVSANATAMALEGQSKLSGTASSSIGVCQAIVPSIVAPFVGILGNKFLAMSTIQIVVILISFGFAFFGTSIFRKNTQLN